MKIIYCSVALDTNCAGVFATGETPQAAVSALVKRNTLRRGSSVLCEKVNDERIATLLCDFFIPNSYSWNRGKLPRIFIVIRSGFKNYTASFFTPAGAVESTDATAILDCLRASPARMDVELFMDYKGSVEALGRLSSEEREELLCDLFRYGIRLGEKLFAKGGSHG